MSKFTMFSIAVLVAVYFLAAPPAPTPDGVKNEPVQVEPTPEVEPVKNAILEIQSATWCAPCRRFKASGIINELKSQGWTIVYADGLGKSYPTFRLWVNGEQKTWSGYSSKSSFYRTFNSNMKKLQD